MSKIAQTLFAIFFFGFLFSTIAKVEYYDYRFRELKKMFDTDASTYVSAGPTEGGFGLSAGITLLPPVVIIPGIDIGIDYDVVGNTKGVFLTAQIGLGIPFIYGYAEWGIGTMHGNFKNSEGAWEDQVDSARKMTLGMAFGVYMAEVIYEHIRWYSFVDSRVHLLGLRFRFY